MGWEGVEKDCGGSKTREGEGEVKGCGATCCTGLRGGWWDNTEYWGVFAREIEGGGGITTRGAGSDGGFAFLADFWL